MCACVTNWLLWCLINNYADYRSSDSPQGNWCLSSPAEARFWLDILILYCLLLLIRPHHIYRYKYCYFINTEVLMPHHLHHQPGVQLSLFSLTTEHRPWCCYDDLTADSLLESTCHSFAPPSIYRNSVPKVWSNIWGRLWSWSLWRRLRRKSTSE